MFIYFVILCLFINLFVLFFCLNLQFRQEVEGWAERVSELEEEMQRCEFAHSAMLQDVGNKDERIKVWLLPPGPSDVLLSTR